MENEEQARFSDAIMCLQQALVEGNKLSNVDIDLMLENIHRCSFIIQEQMESEQDDFFKTSLTSLSGSLAAHVNVLTNKLQNLSQNQQIYDSTHNSVVHSPEVVPMSPALGKGKNIRMATPIPIAAPVPKFHSTKDDTNDRDDSVARSRLHIIESTILSSGHVKFDDVIGLKESKRSLYDAIIMPLMFPQLFSGGRRPWQRILLFGPPGTGKSRLAKAVSTEVKATFYCVSSTDLMSSWVGESEKLIKELFHHSNSQEGQAIIFIDEIDSLCRHRNSREDEGTRRIKTELLIQMDGAVQCANPKILLLCATNCPWDLDSAFLRRFQKRIYIPLPDFQSRLDMLKLHSKGNPVNLSNEDWSKLASHTEGYSGSDLSTLTLGALLQPIRDLQTASKWEITPDGKWRPHEGTCSKAIRANISDIPPDKICAREVNIQDFLECLKSHPPTVSAAELRRFQEFTSSFGQMG